ncbi:MAG: glycosyltransferase family 39 protein [Nitrospinae bacterium]|nr:glycosyltransferase family 39 protein [Nitrospinota bacterium]
MKKTPENGSPANAGGMLSRPGVAGLLIFAGFAAYYLSFCQYGINLWDEGGLYYGGERYLHGQRVFKDFLGYPPGIYWIAEGTFRLFGDDMLPLRRVLAVLTAFFPLFGWLIARRFLSGVWLAAAVLLVASTPAVYYQRSYGLMLLFAAWAVLACLDDRKRWPWMAAAALTAYYFKVEVLLIIGPLYAWLLLDAHGFRRRGWALLAAIAIFFTLFFWNDLVDFLLFKVRTELSLWGNSFPVPWRPYQGAPLGLFTFLESMLFYLPFAAGALLAGHGLRAKGLTDVERTRFLALAYLQTGAMALVVMRAGFDNLVRCLPLFFIAAVVLARIAVSLVRDAGWRRPALAASVLLWGLYIADFNVRNGFYIGSVGAVREVAAVIPEGKARGVVASEADAGAIGRMTEWIRMAATPRETIFAAPLNPIWYYLSDRDNPTFYDWVLPGTLRGFADEERLVAQLRAARPALVILVDIAIDNKADRRLAVYAPRFTAWMLEGYAYSGAVSYFQIWRRK